ncbi:MAG TPA: glycine cleavage system protein H [Thermoanaerobaculia bacterium]|nr:glycine cleavage system protein H [Thermoanaerobaculia bacterium]
MLPGNTDFILDPANVIFLGAFALVLVTAVGTLAFAIVSARRAVARGQAASILWHEEFEGLPSSAKACRHDLTGEMPGRRCERAFDCKGCETHARLVADAKPLPPIDAGGFFVLADRLYHRGHAWLKPEEDGTVTLGLDDLATRLVGTPDALDLPAVGERLAENGPAFRLKAGKARVRVASPVSGEVVETGGFGRGFLLRVRPDGALDTRALLSGREAAAFFARERDRLQLVLSAARGIPALADGGLLVEDLSKAIPDEDRDRVLGEMLLES